MKRASVLGFAIAIMAIMTLRLTVLGLPLAHATVPADSTGGPATPVTITFWDPYGGVQLYMLQLIDEFNSTNTFGITVQRQYAGNYTDIHNSVIAGLRSGGPLPNLVVAYPNSFADFARYGAVRFLDDYLADPVIGITNTADIIPAVLDYYRLPQYGNQLAGLQYGRSVGVMYYNATLLISESVAIPATWDDFRTACISLTTTAVSGTVLTTDASTFALWLWTSGGELLTADSRGARFQEQPGITILSLLQDLVNQHCARTPTGTGEEQQAFGKGQAGFVFQSSAAIPFYRASMNSGAKHAWGITRAPAIPGHEAVNSFGAGAGILHESDDKDRAAWIFLSWLTEREQTARWAVRSGYFPVRISATSHPSMTQKLASDAQYAQAFTFLPLGRTEPGARGYSDIRVTLGTAVSNILKNGANVTGTLQATGVQADATLARLGPASNAISSGGGTLVYSNMQGVSATVQFPAGVISQTVSYVPLDDLPTPALGFALVPSLTFSQPVTLTLHYRDSDVAGMDEGALRLYNYNWPTASWSPADPCGGYVRDPANNSLQAIICHFSDYALKDWLHNLYLPIALKNLGP